VFGFHVSAPEGQWRIPSHPGHFQQNHVGPSIAVAADQIQMLLAEVPISPWDAPGDASLLQEANQLVAKGLFLI
jgi:hypothetical protein